MLRGEQKFLLGATLILFLGVFFMVAQVGNPKPVAGSSLSGVRTGEGLLVTGYGQVRVPADVARVTVGIVGDGKAVAEAQRNAERKVEALRRAVTADNLGDVAFHVERVTLHGKPDIFGVFGSTVAGGPFRMAYRVRLATRDVGAVGRLSDAVLHAGATVIGIEYGLREITKARDVAIAAASTDAAQKARSMAQSLGVTLTGVKYVGDGSITLDTPIPAVTPGLADAESRDPSKTVPEPTIRNGNAARGSGRVEVLVRAAIQVEYGL